MLNPYLAPVTPASSIHFGSLFAPVLFFPPNLNVCGSSVKFKETHPAGFVNNSPGRAHFVIITPLLVMKLNQRVEVAGKAISLPNLAHYLRWPSSILACAAHTAQGVNY